MKDSPVIELISERRIASRVRELGAEIAADLGDAEPVVVGVLTGCFVFMADLVRAIGRPLTCDFIGLSSYGAGKESSGQVRVTKDLVQAIDGRTVLVVEDIVDTGLSMEFLRRRLTDLGPADVRVAALLSKPSRRRVETRIDYLGFTIEDRFVVGYGLDYDGRYRNLPFVGVVEE